jgi:hypothetical protein
VYTYYRANFSTKGPIKRSVKHVLPTGTTPVTKVNGRRLVGPWEFFCGGWKDLGNNTSFRDGASKAKAFPDSRRGKLDKNLLLTNLRMEIGDT